ncbi:hypothetical protein KBZ94_09985 [Streptomyces sp. RM72]|uniref:hypothetical protein n=1 Tax=Streptomyces sp. RM72 TaxID=1115510 RepID=UPI001B37F3A3|nr:hypothetical protein [Streptomyces sp. RM72]MBQ0885268.1 hypothetical protein [Streptomyces sp. RM72]
MDRTELSLLGLGFELPVSGTDAASGWSNGTSYGAPDAALERVVAADVVTHIRNRLVHPKEAQQSVYSVNGLVTEAWLLTRHYLTLLALRSIGYRGAYQDLSRTNGWVGETERVPWA